MVRASCATDIGRRMNNEDAYLVNEKMGLFVVADGMGGCDKGEVASWFTIKNLERIAISASLGDGEGAASPISLEEIRHSSFMEYAVMSINKKLYTMNEEEAKKTQDPVAQDPAQSRIAEKLRKRKRMGTTLVSLLICDKYAYVTHVGDSRIYRITKDKIWLITHDHSWVDERIREGLISPDEAKTYEMRNVITRSVGFKQNVEADIDALTLYPPERFLLCSDGLSNAVREEEIHSLCQMRNLKAACDELVALALANGGRDNITVVLVEITTSSNNWSPGILSQTDGFNETLL